MNVITRTAATILLLLLVLTAPAAAQQKRQTTPRPQPKATPAPTFETLIPSDSYTIYGEVRGAGQLIRSNAVNDLLEPILKVSAPPKEFRTVVKWLNAHADDVMTSRLLLAAWPTVGAKQAPKAIIAIEFPSAEEATKFAATLDEFLQTVVPKPTPEPDQKSAEGTSAADKTKPTGPPDPGFHLQRMGSLIVITPRPWTMKQLKPAGSKLLAEDVNFRAARNRFTTEPIFVYVDVKAIEKEEEDRRKRYEEERRVEEEEQAKREAAAAKSDQKVPEEPAEEELTEEEKAAVAEAEALAQVEAVSSPEEAKDSAAPDLVSTLLSGLGSSFFSGASDYPDAVALALSFEGDSFDLRALLVNQGAERADAIPFVPMLITGAALSPEAPNIFPSDTEMLATMSLDLPQIYAAMSKPQPKESFIRTEEGKIIEAKETEPESPFVAIEQRLKIKLKDDLLPLLGSEVSLSFPMKDMNVMGLAGITPATVTTTSGSSTAVIVEKEQPAVPGPVLAIQVKDKEGLRALMPKLIDNLGIKGASSLMQTERREDTEIVSFANVFAYAFVGNFMVLSSDIKTTRHIVDSYLKHETLSSNIEFKNSTRWQPRPLHGQLYISPSLMEGYKNWAQQPSTHLSEQVRAFLMRASSAPQPITYSLSNEGFGPLHEVHIPKNLILMAVAGISGEMNPPATVQNERLAIGIVFSIARAQEEFKKKSGASGSLEELIAADLISKEMIDRSGYRFDLTVSGDKFEVTAIPLEYGKTGKVSIFMDSTGVLRGGDKGGASATASDPPIY